MYVPLADIAKPALSLQRACPEDPRPTPLTSQGEYVSISWKGKDIAVYGARRDNHVSHPAVYLKMGMLIGL